MFALLPLGTVVLLAATTVQATESVLSFTQPAANWEQSLPIGSGRLGAGLFSRTDNDVIVLNEDSFWSGGFRNRVNSQAKQAFPQVRSLMDQGKLTEASNMWSQKMAATPTNMRKYEPAGYIVLGTGHSQNQASGYRRTLDLETGIANATYTVGGVTYTREAVASALDNVVAFQFTASSPNSYNMTIRLDRSSSEVASTGSDGGLWLRSSGRDDSSYTNSQYAIVSTVGGTLTSSGSSITVQGATSVTIMWDAETLFYYPEGQGRYEQVLKSRVQAASSKGYAAVKSAAVADHQKYYKRSSFSAGPSSNSASANKATNLRLADIRSVGSFSQDPEMLALGYNYGRYMLIASSRPGSLPANLQGVWNDKFNPPWDSKFTININLQMNYWLADQNGLDEMLEPLWTHFQRMQTRGSAVAQNMYGLPGWVCHHNTDLWGDCAPQDAGTQWATWPMGGAWMLETALDHYRFTKDTQFASNTLLPLLRSAITFYNAFSVLQDGYYVTYPSNSPENSYFIPQGSSNAGQQTGIDKSSQCDRSLMWHLYTGLVEISAAVGTTDGVSEAQSYLARIKAPDVSSTTGRLLEWSRDYAETEPEHRHFSPVIGLHPGHQYSPLTNASLAEAARKLIQHRMDSGSGTEGWSRIWASALYSRLYDGSAAAVHAHALMAAMKDNLWSVTSGIYQADANFGLTSAVNEMLLQSHDGILHLGPAIPGGGSGLAQGRFTGWKARGNFVVDAQWSGGNIVGATIRSSSGGKLAVRVQDGRAFKIGGNTYSQPVDTTAGSTYTVSF